MHSLAQIFSAPPPFKKHLQQQDVIFPKSCPPAILTFTLFQLPIYTAAVYLLSNPHYMLNNASQCQCQQTDQMLSISNMVRPIPA